jgi:hypothetical protein
MGPATRTKPKGEIKENRTSQEQRHLEDKIPETKTTTNYRKAT